MFISPGLQNLGLAISSSTRYTFAVIIYSICYVSKAYINNISLVKYKDWKFEVEEVQSQEFQQNVQPNKKVKDNIQNPHSLVHLLNLALL